LEEDEEERRRLGFRGPQNYKAREGATPDLYNHAPTTLARAFVGDEVWKSYFKLTIERNPYDKLISLYWWANRALATPAPWDVFLDKVKPHAITNWDIYAIGDRIAADFVGRYETLEDDLARACKQLGLPALRLGRAKSGARKDHRHHSKVLSPRARAVVESLCARELAAFGYTWDEGQG
jgi:hypothetical protein